MKIKKLPFKYLFSMKKFNLKTSYFHKQEVMKKNKNMIKIFCYIKGSSKKSPILTDEGLIIKSK